MLADAGAAGGDEQIDAADLVGGGGDGVQIVRRDRQHHGVAPCGGDEGGEGVGVGRDDAAGPDGVAGKGDLVAGGEDSEARAAVDREPGVVGCRREADGARGEAGAGREQDVTGREIAAAGADVAAGDRCLAQREAVAIAVGVLLDGDRVGAGGDQAAGE